MSSRNAKLACRTLLTLCCLVCAAPGPDQGIVIPTSGGLSSQWDPRRYEPQDIWAFQPVKHYSIPDDVIVPDAIRNPIDAFIQKKLKQKGVSTIASAADRLTLLRRVTLDLTGLPPTPEQVQAFLKDESVDAF